MTTPSSAAVMPQSTVAGRPQPQTTNEGAGGPFIRHAPSGRRPIYNQPGTFGLFFGPPMVSSPGWNKGFRLKFSVGAGGSGGSTLNADAPYNEVQLLQLKDAWGTNLLAGPGWEMLYFVPLISGQFGWNLTRDPRTLPTWAGIVAASAVQTWSTYMPFEFTKGYGVISGANAALLPVLQLTLNTLAASSYAGGTAPTTVPAPQLQLDADYYWLPNVPVDPPGIGTTCQYIFQPCNPVITSAGSLRVQLPRLGGYLTVLGLELRDSTNARVDAWPNRPGIYIDGVELIDTDITTLYDDMAIQTGIGATTGPTQTAAGTANFPRPTGTVFINRKVSLGQFDAGLLDTGEVFLSTNPGTQVEIAGVPWGTISNSPATLNAVIGQVVPSGPLVQGLPQV
jgi:hypothetical protein